MTDRRDEEPLLALLAAVVPALLSALERLLLVRRYRHLDTEPLLAVLTDIEAPLQAAITRIDAAPWPPHLVEFQRALRAVAADTAQAVHYWQQGRARRAMRATGDAVARLYPFAEMLPPVSRFFLEPGRRRDDALLARLAAADQRRADVGVLHVPAPATGRGDAAVYVPEYYRAEQQWPLVVALHGGMGTGIELLWQWLPVARSRGLIVVCPTSKGDTWPLHEPDYDADALTALVDWVVTEWQTDPDRVLLSGISDGATYSYLYGLMPGTRYTHLAPIAGTFHPLLLQGLDVADRPIYLVHGVHDDVFPVAGARSTAGALASAGARVTYQEIEDLAHAFPAEALSGLLDWFEATPRAPR
jgi:phospholipase/carboxylesterase